MVRTDHSGLPRPEPGHAPALTGRNKGKPKDALPPDFAMDLPSAQAHAAKVSASWSETFIKLQRRQEALSGGRAPPSRTALKRLLSSV